MRYFLKWFGRYFSREWLLAVAVIWLSYKLAQAGQLSTQWTAVLGVAATYIGKMGWEKVRNGKSG